MILQYQLRLTYSQKITLITHFRPERFGPTDEKICAVFSENEVDIL